MLLKRCADIFVSIVALLLFSPVMGAAALAVWLESGSPVLFRQERVGRWFCPFQILKFRTMRVENRELRLTVSGDNRVTAVGRFLRRTKIDELPQFWNVLRGEMSVVGPRPDVSEFVDLFRDRYRRILDIRPGITDLASIYYRNEELVLARASDPVKEYRERILPAKLDLAERYLNERSIRLDLAIIFCTAIVTLLPRFCNQNE